MTKSLLAFTAALALGGCALLAGARDEVARQAITPGSDLSATVGQVAPDLSPAVPLLGSPQGLPPGATGLEIALYVLGGMATQLGLGYARREVQKRRGGGE